MSIKNRSPYSHFAENAKLKLLCIVELSYR